MGNVGGLCEFPAIPIKNQLLLVDAQKRQVFFQKNNWFGKDVLRNVHSPIRTFRHLMYCINYVLFTKEKGVEH